MLIKESQSLTERHAKMTSKFPTLFATILCILYFINTVHGSINQDESKYYQSHATRTNIEKSRFW